jgi:hypothetical protein
MEGGKETRVGAAARGPGEEYEEAGRGMREERMGMKTKRGRHRKKKKTISAGGRPRGKKIARGRGARRHRPEI